MSDDSFPIKEVKTSPYQDQKPGTSGLRKKVTHFQQENYLENFIQSTLDVIGDKRNGATLIVSGDGRYWANHALSVIVRMCAANGLGKMVIGERGWMSTPCVSNLIRTAGKKCVGGIILTASHNPGGPKEDFGVKYNSPNGGPAVTKVTDAIFGNTKNISTYKIAEANPFSLVGDDGETKTATVDLFKVGTYKFGELEVEVVDAQLAYRNMMEDIFDFPLMQKFIDRTGFSICFDGMNAVTGPFAKALFGVKKRKYNRNPPLMFARPRKGTVGLRLQNCRPLADFGGLHPDPNVSHAHDLTKTMLYGVEETKDEPVPDLGAACDGDGDRNMIMGPQFFVSPSDSLAVIVHYAQSAIPYFRDLKAPGVGRSMPTSRAVDVVAKALKWKLFEVPTGWKYFTNLMDTDQLHICGEESFGTGSNHVREKDGLWAILCWINILAHVNRDSDTVKVGVRELLYKHWDTYGRHYYARHDYEAVSADKANAFFDKLRGMLPEGKSSTAKWGNFEVGEGSNEYSYEDPVDKSVAKKQGIRFSFTDGSRVVFRLSGTGSVGATVRVYLERYVAPPSDGKSEQLRRPFTEGLADIVEAMRDATGIAKALGREKPDVIT